MKAFIDDQEEFKNGSFSDWQTVQLTECIRSAVKFTAAKDKFGCKVLNQLRQFDGSVRQITEEGVAVIKMRYDQHLDKGSAGFSGKMLT